MFCPVCGTLNEDTSKFCGGCGYRLMEEAAPVEEITPAEEAALVEEVISAEEITPAEEVAPAEEAAPAEEVISDEEIAPVEEVAPVGEAAPVEQIPVQSAYRMPVRQQKPKDKGLGWGIASLVLGGGSLLCCGCPGGGLIAAVLAVILACVGIVKSRRCGRVNGLAIAGLVCGGVGILIGAVALMMGLTVGAGVFAGMMETQPNTYYPY